MAVALGRGRHHLAVQPLDDHGEAGSVIRPALVQVILVTAKVRGQSRTSRCSWMQREPWERRETELLRILSGEARSTG